MANIIFKYKGKNDLNLTREFNSTPAFVANKDDVKFNDTSNPFSDYLASSNCGSWTDDKIKILSLPHKGRLFYLTNPGGGTAVYADVTVGQEIVVRDMTDNKVLKFSAEGSSDGQYTGNYFTEFTFERYCATTPSNVVSTVKLNMIDIQQAVSGIMITNKSVNQSAGSGTFNLVVTGAPFVGYAIAKMTNSSYNDYQKIASVSVETVHLSPKINSYDPTGSEDVVSVPVNIPIGNYNNGEILVSSPAPFTEDVYCNARLTFSLTDVFEDGIPAATIMVPLDRPGVPA